ncbi:MAG TPA: type IIL restriction-modification enzyme MmeI, partial [Bacteroidia bacterium]
KDNKVIFSNNIKTVVSTINPYLVEGEIVYVESRQKPLAHFPEMNFGNMPADGGKLLFTTEEKNKFISDEPLSEKYFKKLISAYEFLNGLERWCLWLEGCTEQEINSMKLVKSRVDQLKQIRKNSSRPYLASIPHLFAQITQPTNKEFILIPRHSSENRKYIPMGLFNSDNKAHDSCLIIPTNNAYLFGILTSLMHMVWTKSVAGRIKSDFRYSKDIVYNNFPFPLITAHQKQELDKFTYRVLEEREKHPEKTLAQLYDPRKMPGGLREAHHQLDLSVEQCYRSKPFETDEERIEYLFKLYEQMMAEEKDKGTLFEINTKSKKIKKKLNA